MKYAKVLLTQDEVNLLVTDVIGDIFTRLGDDGLENSPYAKKLVHLSKKIVKAYNKTGHYYLWQLKDRDGDVVPENIRDEWK